MGLPALSAVLRGLVVRLHLAAALLPAVFFLAFAWKAAAIGFAPRPEAYPPFQFSPERNRRQVLELLHEVVRRKGAGAPPPVVAVWGLAAEPGGRLTAGATGVQIARLLAGAGARVRVTDPAVLEEARFLLGREAEVVPDPWRAAADADILVLGCPWPEYVETDFGRVADTLAGRVLLDPWGRWSGAAVEEAGLDYLRVGTDSWPMWLDPELAVFEERFRAALAAAGQKPEDATVLLVPWLPMRSLAPRSRWYLPLNYRLLPARLLLPRPELACGTIPQYWDWVQRILDEGPASGALWPEAYLDGLLQRTGADWILYFVQNEDFRLSDWRLLQVRRDPGGGGDGG